MKKNKVLSVSPHVLKIAARVLVLNIPAVIILLGLMVAHKLSWISAGISLVAFWAITAIIVCYVFKDLDNFIAYLKKLAQGFEPELPKLHWGIFSSTRLANTFLSVKNLWSNQFASADSVLENLPNPMLMVDQNQKIVFANLVALDTFDKKLMGQKIQSVFESPFLIKALQLVQSFSSESQTIAELDLHTQSNQLQTFQVKIDALPAPTKDGAVCVISFFDITPFKLFKKQQSDFFANASHELKTPLAIISGCVETLQDSARNDAAARDKFLSLIAEQTTRMTDLIHQMLQLSRLQVDVPINQKNSFSINDLLQKVVTDFDVRTQALHKKIVFNKQAHLPLFQADRNELYHAFQNLIDNALKYSAPRSTIRINTYSDTVETPALVVSIHNIGRPIPADQLDRIWDQFYRGNPGATEGSGLGLSIVHKIIQKYHGHIDVISTEKTGTTFTVYLPVAP